MIIFLKGAVGALIALAVLFAGSGPAAGELVQESPGQKAHYGKDGLLTRLEIDADRDGRFEIEETYVKGKRVKRREDLDGDGHWERQITWKGDGSAVLRESRKGRSEVQLTYYEPGGTVRRIEKDADGNGSPEEAWEYSGGKLIRVTKPEGNWHYRDGRLSRAELDPDRKGRVDRIEYYDHGGRLEKTEQLGADGKVKARWFFDEKGQPLRAEENLNSLGRPQTRREFAKDGTLLRLIDADRNGVFELRERLAPDGSLLSREEDLDGDGVFDLRLGKPGSVSN
jgi:antitoxin component YwqK of YwqJK toxin-antitoxin module